MTHQHRPSAALRSCIAALLLIAPAGAWSVVNLGWAERSVNALDELREPLWYIGCVGIAIAPVVLVALAIRRRSNAELAGLCAIIALGALASTMTAFGLAFRSSPVNYAEPIPVDDLTRFTRLYYRMHDVNSMGHAHAFMRKSWRFDDYGLIGKQPYIVLWEEYGVPLRCFRSPLGMDFDNHEMQVFRRIEIIHIPFIANTLIFAAVLFVAPRFPMWVTRRYRWQEGRCIGCGYLLKDLPRCPECGTLANRHTCAP